MAAEVVVGPLLIGFSKIDLSHVAKKYIGETEKNLRVSSARSGAAMQSSFSMKPMAVRQAVGD
jgi:hypothetical protein